MLSFIYLLTFKENGHWQVQVSMTSLNTALITCSSCIKGIT